MALRHHSLEVYSGELCWIDGCFGSGDCTSMSLRRGGLAVIGVLVVDGGCLMFGGDDW